MTGGTARIRKLLCSKQFSEKISPEQHIAGSSAPFKSIKTKGEYKAAHEKDTRLQYTTGVRQKEREHGLMCKGNMKQVANKVSRALVTQRTKHKFRQQALQS